jgi:hypothetical protein
LTFPDYDVSPDDQRFLMLKAVGQAQASAQINVVLNWTEELKRFVPAGTKQSFALNRAVSVHALSSRETGSSECRFRIPRWPIVKPHLRNRIITSLSRFGVCPVRWHRRTQGDLVEIKREK